MFFFFLFFFFFFLTNSFVQDLKLSDLLPNFILLRALSFLLDLIITSYRCIGQNSPKKLKQKETIRTSKTSHGSQNRTVGPRSMRVPAFLAWNGSKFFRSDRTIRSEFQNLGAHKSGLPIPGLLEILAQGQL